MRARMREKPSVDKLREEKAGFLEIILFFLSSFSFPVLILLCELRTIGCWSFIGLTKRCFL